MESKSLTLSQSLCPQMGQQVTIQGNSGASIFKGISINVTRCNSTTDPTCVNDTVFAGIEAMAGKFLYFTYFINTMVNPGK